MTQVESTKRYRDRRKAEGLCSISGCPEKRLPEHHCCAGHRETEILRGRERMRASKLKVLDAYDGRVCVGCGETDIVCLSLDHINGGGNKHRKTVMGDRMIAGWPFYRWIIRNAFPPGFRVLCMNCQFRTRFGGSLPNERGTMKPTIGRSVIFHTPEHDRNMYNGATECPALIVRVWSDTCVNLKVIADATFDYWVTSVCEGTGPRQ
jgi:hypothetical protein